MPASLSQTIQTIQIGEITVEVTQKNIKNIHLSVYPPSGAVRIAAPLRMKPEVIRLFAINKLGWIRAQQQKLRAQERESPRQYLERESHHVWGRRYLLQLSEADAAPRIELEPRYLKLQVRPGTDEPRKRQIIEAWYRAQVREAAAPLIAHWEEIMGVEVAEFIVREMKTKWGSCSPGAATIRLNTALGQKPPQCLEYIIVHEMTHLLEPTHNARFVLLMNRFLPGWPTHRDLLNSLPLKQEKWSY